MASLTIDEIRSVANLQKNNGRLKLAKYLGWDEFDEDDDLRKSILLDFYYDILTFGVQKGFPLNHVSSVVSLGAEILKQSTGKPLVEAIKIYKKLCLEKQISINDQNLKIFTDYFFTSFMQHYNLYQYVFTNEQSREINITSLKVETVVDPLPFTEAKQAHLWEYEQKYDKIAQEEERKIEELHQKMEKFTQEDQEKLSKVSEDFDQIQTPVERQTLENMISDLIGAHMTALNHNLTVTCQQTAEELQFKLEKSSLPRPQELGAPPRYGTKTPIACKNMDKSGKRPKSKENPKSAKGKRA